MSINRWSVCGLGVAAISLAWVVPVAQAQAPAEEAKKDTRGAPRRAFPCRRARASPRPRSRPTGA